MPGTPAKDVSDAHGPVDRVTEPGERPATRTFTWRPSTGNGGRHVRLVALVRETPMGPVLQHVRRVTVREAGPSDAELDTAPVLEDLPDGLRGQLPDDVRPAHRGRPRRDRADARGGSRA